MNKFNLDSILKKARLPEPPEEFWEGLPQHVARESRRARLENSPQKRIWFPRLAWGFAMMICIFAAFAIGHWHGRLETKTIASNDFLENPKFIHETLAMFPNRVRAIIQNEKGLNLILSENENMPASPPLYVHICDGKNCSSLVTFSGQEIQIDGQKLTVLSDARGGIILEGKEFVWSNDEKIAGKSHLKIEAKNLGAVAM